MVKKCRISPGLANSIYNVSILGLKRRGKEKAKAGQKVPLERETKNAYTCFQLWLIGNSICIDITSSVGGGTLRQGPPCQLPGVMSNQKSCLIWTKRNGWGVQEIGSCFLGRRSG